MKHDLVSKALKVIEGYDRMPDNPDLNSLKDYINSSLKQTGTVNFIVFVCPKFNTKALVSASKELYWPVIADRGDLFEDRIPKIKELRQKLFSIGVISTLDVILGDNDATTYITPFLSDYQFDTKKVLERQEKYLKSFVSRIEENFGSSLTNVWSLANLGITLSDKNVLYDEQDLEREVEFFKWLFGENGPYKGVLTFETEQMYQMAKLKFSAYAAQGELLDEIGGILLQSESPGLWIRRTNMFRGSGSGNIPAIYPWIRREEVNKLKKD